MLGSALVSAEIELLRSWQGGNERAGSRLFECHYDAIYRFFYGKVEDSVVEELAQDTFLSVVRRRDALDGRRSVRAYLFAVARNKLYDRLRYQGRVPRSADVSECPLHDVGPTPSAEVARRQQQRLLLQALRNLPLNLQILMELRHFENLHGPELADALEIPEGTVRSRLRRAHHLLRRKIEQMTLRPEQLHSTLSDLEDWARTVREHAAP